MLHSSLIAALLSFCVDYAALVTCELVMQMCLSDPSGVRKAATNDNDRALRILKIFRILRIVRILKLAKFAL